jgi:hypothetical protein
VKSGKVGAGTSGKSLSIRGSQVFGMEWTCGQQEPVYRERGGIEHEGWGGGGNVGEEPKSK